MMRTRRATTDLDPVWGCDFDPGLFDQRRRGFRRTDVEVYRRGNAIEDDQVAPRAIAEDLVDAELEPEDPEVAKPSPQECGATETLANSPEPDLVERTSCTCLWCGTALEARLDGGSPRRFCSTACRRSFDQAGRA
jgi:hypothetical protein